ncbi:GDP/UDP-N,N'-diacetylbacillosamine 2-epimerase (hydrolysing) [Polaromonas sp. YR568]|uniref:UDP-N-acetylglucosamine 2-epimerase n=1 Tax=Polaromonas sp. YR568 TaxID=1855301 RepID=UPI0008E994DB|nr:UDP-N-acetylglucosamine 2-epimerase [Polaromonas sp. YR568]SFU91923.1 GDP/UDP-N,N'-diacetylbacillosamine 2-epimerase (hydrolysing) [Polaromonas sp. YR568]
MKRKVCYITGTRADFGLMRSTLTALQDSQALELSIVVTGMHLSDKYGKTADDIKAAGLPVNAVVDVDFASATGAEMARNLGKMVSGFVDAFLDIKPDLVMVLGDRGEMLAGALSAVHLNIPVVHIHGGERSGTIDESIRHAISKLSHFHFVSTSESRDRLVRMGEQAANVYLTGAPGLDGIEALAVRSREELLRTTGLDPTRPVALMVYHPVVQETENAGAGTAGIIDTLLTGGLQLVALKPNSDAGSDQIRAALEEHSGHDDVRIVTHFPRELFVSWMAAADLMIGNSSAGIIEAASFGTPVINIGSRQNLRERNANVTDVAVDTAAIEKAVQKALGHGRYERLNLYGDGHSVDRIARLIETLPLDPSVMMKSNAY